MTCGIQSESTRNPSRARADVRVGPIPIPKPKTDFSNLGVGTTVAGAEMPEREGFIS